MKFKFETLRERLKLEELSFFIVDQLLFHLNNENWEKLIEELTSLLKKLRPLSINEIRRLVDEADKCAAIIKDKEIVLFLGGTGAGKSTHIHFLAGSKLVPITTKEGLKHLVPTNIRNPALNKVSTSPSTKSETRFITAVPIRVSDMDGISNDEIILCDTPGFGDTNGAEVDIANGCAIVRALKGCKNVRIVLIISLRGMGDKLTAIKDLAHLMIQMVSYLKSNMNTISYFFSKVPTNEINTINALLKDLLKSLTLEEKLDESLKLFLQDMIRKTREGQKFSIDLINEKPGNYLDDLLAMSPIGNPDEVFKISINEKSKGILKGLCSNVNKHLKTFFK